MHLKSSEGAAQRADFGKAQQHYISTFIKVQHPFNEKPLLALGAKIGTRAGDVYTVQVPEKQVKNLAQLKGILYIQLDEPIATNMDPARRSSRVDSVQRGINLPLAYTGKNVVVGIIDAGFDYGHPHILRYPRKCAAC